MSSWLCYWYGHDAVVMADAISKKLFQNLLSDPSPVPARTIQTANSLRLDSSFSQ